MKPTFIINGNNYILAGRTHFLVGTKRELTLAPQ